MLPGCLLIFKSKDWASDWNLWACAWHLISSESVLRRVIWLGCFLRKLQSGGQHLLVIAFGWSGFRHKNPPILLMEDWDLAFFILESERQKNPQKPSWLVAHLICIYYACIPYNAVFSAAGLPLNYACAAQLKDLSSPENKLSYMLLGRVRDL